MANHNLPTVTSGYLNFVSELNGRLVDCAAAFDPAFVTVTNPPTNTVRFSSAANAWQRWNGSAWVALATTYAISISGNAATATAFQTARTIGGVSFNGTGNISLPGVNTAGNQSTTGNAATVTNGVYTTGNQTIGGNKTLSGVTGIGAGWTVEQNGTGLLFRYLGTSRMRLDASGNLTVSGNITAFGTV